MKGNKLAALVCALSLLVVPARAAGDGYTDVAGDEWFAEAVTKVTEEGIMTGVTDELFCPYDTVSRATVITVLWRLSGSPDASVEAPFPDTVDTWYETAAAWAKGYGIAGGYDGTFFSGDDPVTREQLAAFLYRYDVFTGAPIAQGAMGLFEDASAISDWAVEPMRHAVGSGILRGDEGQLFPQAAADRASLAVMLQRMLTPAAG